MTVLVAAASIGCVSQVTEPVITGSWGGPHIQLLATSETGQLEYDCAIGTIDGPLVPDADGNFDARGTHVFEHGGPVREDEIPDERAAMYRGWSNGREMRLTVVLLDTGATVGTFSLTLEQTARLFKCL